MVVCRCLLVCLFVVCLVFGFFFFQTIRCLSFYFIFLKMNILPMSIRTQYNSISHLSHCSHYMSVPDWFYIASLTSWYHNTIILLVTHHHEIHLYWTHIYMRICFAYCIYTVCMYMRNSFIVYFLVFQYTRVFCYFYMYFHIQYSTRKHCAAVSFM